MPAPQTQYVNTAPGPISLVTTAETVVATTRAVSSQAASSTFGLFFWAIILAGASTTAIQCRIRRDGLTGGVVLNTGNLTLAATQALPFSFMSTDNPAGDVAGQTWVLTVAQIAATGNGSVTSIATSVIVAV